MPDDPFKLDRTPSPLRLLPGGSSPLAARVDPAHTWAIAGMGKDLCGSSLVLLAKMGLYGRGSLDTCLRRAYDRFEAYQVRAKKTSSIDDFSYKTLKCGKTLLADMLH